MKNLVYKTIPFDIKNVDVEEGTLWAVGSTEGFDRDGDRIRMDGWDIENYLKNPVILWAHNYREPPIGKALDVVPQANGLWFKILFAKTGKAQEIFGLYADGFMRAWSVGFLPKQKQELKHEDDLAGTGWDYIRQELLELSAVPVPSNPDALNVLRAKGIFDGMTDELIDNLVSQMESSVEELPPAHMKPYPNEHACRLKDPAQYDTCRRGDRTAQEPESVRGKKYHVIYCKKGDGPMEQQAFRYPVATWTAQQAKAHCNYNKGSFAAASGGKTEEVAEATDIVLKFAGSPRNRFGTHSSYKFKGDYAAAWRCHFSKVGGGSTSAAASGPIRGTVRRTEMIAAAMKPPCQLPSTDSIGPRSGPKSPLDCSFPSKPSDYGLSSWDEPETDADREGIKLSCADLSVIKKAALAEIKRRAQDREEEGRDIEPSEVAMTTVVEEDALYEDLFEICGMDAETALSGETDEHSAGLPSAAQEPATEVLPDDIVAELLKAIRGIKEVFK